jgi:hypothetical protein
MKELSGPFSWKLSFLNGDARAIPEHRLFRGGEPPLPLAASGIKIPLSPVGCCSEFSHSRSPPATRQTQWRSPPALKHCRPIHNRNPTKAKDSSGIKIPPTLPDCYRGSPRCKPLPGSHQVWWRNLPASRRSRRSGRDRRHPVRASCRSGRC